MLDLEIPVQKVPLKQQSDQRTLLVENVRRWSDLNTDAVLDANCKTFSIPSIDGFVGYRVETNCAVVFGDPVCAFEDQLKLVEAFENFCKQQQLCIVYAIVSEKFANYLHNKNKSVLIQFGTRLVLEPSDDPLKRKGSKAVLLRKKVKHATHEAITVHEYTDHDPKIEKQIEEIGCDWLKARQGLQVYIAHLDFFNDRQGKRWFYAQQGERIVGFLILNQLQASSGWLLNNLILTSDAPSGTSELLITSVLKTLDVEKSQNVVIGPVTGTEISNIVGLGKLTSWVVKAAFKATKNLFKLDGQRIFWEKFQPKQEPSYIAFDKINFSSVRALLKAMNVKIKK